MVDGIFPPVTLQERRACLKAMMVGSKPGTIRRVPSGRMRRAAKGEEPLNDSTDESKRNALKLLAIGGVAAIGGAAGGVGMLKILEPPMVGATTYPRVQLLYDDGTPIVASQYKYSYKDNGQIIFDYPLTNEPNMLLNLNHIGSPAPQNPISKGNGTYLVAYSAICQHLGCVPPYISYYPPGQCGSYNGGNAIIHCICHGSSFDPGIRDTSNGGGAAILSGPTVLPIPQVLLDTDSNGYVYAVGMLGPPVKGHSDTLTGGQTVNTKVTASPPATPTQSCPT